MLTQADTQRLTPERTRELLAKPGAILQGHFVGTNGNHLSLYVAKDRATRLTSVTSELCAEIAARFADDDVDAVVAPAVGGIALAQWTAHHLTHLRPDRPEVLALYSEHETEVFSRGRKKDALNPDPVRIQLPWLQEPIVLEDGDELVVVRKAFALKRGFSGDVKGKRILTVEDILTTGGSAASTVKAGEAAGGIVVGCGVLANGGKVTAEAVGVKRLEALTPVERQIYTEEDCKKHGLCARGVPINTDFGHGKAFLDRQRVPPLA